MKGPAMLIQTLVCIILLTSDTPPALSDSEIEKLAPVIRMVAIQLEVLDEAEECFFQNPDCLDGDIRILRERYIELRDAPPEMDWSRFPTGESGIKQLLSFNREYKSNMAHVLRPDDYRIVATETDRLYRIWETLAYVQSWHVRTVDRRKALRRLREMIGKENYAEAKMSLYVPLQYFRSID